MEFLSPRYNYGIINDYKINKKYVPTIGFTRSILWRPIYPWGFEWLGPFYVVAKGKKMYLLLGPFWVIVAYICGQGKIGSDSDSKFSDME